jgi:bifunctional DNase/RNase
MTVYGVSFDLGSKQPIVLLRTVEGTTFLPIWIGQPEAVAILMKLQGSDPPRPLTHDLTCSIIESLDAEVSRVTVTELRENTFIAAITLLHNGDEIEIDSRTSDAIALALRADASIYVADEVIEESGVEFEGGEPELENGVAQPPQLGETAVEEIDFGEFRRFLDTVTPDEFRARETEDD